MTSSLRLGTWLSLGSPVVAELAALCGFDWVLLDLEHGIMVPHVNSAAEAGRIVQAAYYPPRGRRGVARTVRAHDYGLRCPESTPATLLVAQIETLDADWAKVAVGIVVDAV